MLLTDYGISDDILIGESTPETQKKRKLRRWEDIEENVKSKTSLSTERCKKDKHTVLHCSNTHSGTHCSVLGSKREEVIFLCPSNDKK